MKTYLGLLLALATASFLLSFLWGKSVLTGRAVAAPHAVPIVGEAQLTRDFETLQRATIFFQHMSVGGNVLDGVERLGVGKPALLRQHLDLEKDLRNGKFEFRSHHFVTANGGQNRFPKTKIDAFREIVRAASPTPELAMLKLCYIDFAPETDAVDLFAYYERTVQDLQRTYPDLTIVHITTPLVVNDPGWKEVVRSTTGYRDDVAQANIKRHEYNELLRQVFAHEPIFDLAHYEALREDGIRASFTRNEKVYPSLVLEYASDGQHLNPRGGAWIARHFLHALAEVARTRASR